MKEDKLIEGMYIRTEEGLITKYLGSSTREIVNGNGSTYTHHFTENDVPFMCGEYKASHNLIDLIEVGDLVNGKEVLLKNKSSLELDNETGFRRILNRNIKSVVTREQFEKMMYKVGED